MYESKANYLITLHKNLKKLKEQFIEDGLYNVIECTGRDGSIRYLYCGDSNYLFDCSNATDLVTFSEVSEYTVECIFEFDICKTSDDAYGLVECAISYLENKCLSLARMSLQALGEEKRDAIRKKSA